MPLLTSIGPYPEAKRICTDRSFFEQCEAEWYHSYIIKLHGGLDHDVHVQVL